jgi:hypothetical protein
MKLDFRQRTYFVMAVFVSILAALLLPLLYRPEKVFILFPVVMITVFSFILYKIVPGDKR